MRALVARNEPKSSLNSARHNRVGFLFWFQRSCSRPPLDFPCKLSSLFSSTQTSFSIFSLPNNGPFLHPTRSLSTLCPLILVLTLHLSFKQLPIRNRTAGIVRAKGDENATSKHLRQGSGAGVGPSRSTIFGKTIRERPVLNEVTKITVNRKVSRFSLLRGPR